MQQSMKKIHLSQQEKVDLELRHSQYRDRLVLSLVRESMIISNVFNRFFYQT